MNDRVALIAVTDRCGEVSYRVEWTGDSGKHCGAQFYGFGAEGRAQDYKEAVEFYFTHSVLAGPDYNPLLHCAEGDASCLAHRRRNCPECQELGNEG